MAIAGLASTVLGWVQGDSYGMLTQYSRELAQGLRASSGKGTADQSSRVTRWQDLKPCEPLKCFPAECMPEDIYCGK